MRWLIYKNIFLHILLIPFYIFASYEIASIPADKLETLVLFVWLIVIAPITSNFIYSYGNTKGKRQAMVLGDITTFFSTLVIWMLFIILDILLIQMIWSVIVFRSSILFFWFAVIFFDFADFATLDQSKKKK